MINGKKIWTISIAAVLTVTAVAGCSTKAPAQSQSQGAKEDKSVKGALLNVATATTGGVYYPLGNAMAKLWTDKLGVKGSAQATAGAPQNFNLMEKKEAEVAFAQSGVVLQAYNGEDQFKGHPQKDLRSMTYLYPSLIQFVVRKDSGINSIKDLEGKKIVPGAVGSAVEINTREIIGEFGLDYVSKKNVKADFVGFNEASDLMKNKQAESAIFGAGLPTSSVMDMATSFDIKLLSIDSDMLKKISGKYPWYFEYKIPANTYKGQTEDVKAAAIANMLVVRKDMSDELVYQLTKTLHENTADLVAAHSAAKDMKLQDALLGLTIPLHPGAERYFKEKGLDTSKLPKAN